MNERFMRLALELAARGGPDTSPNPKVGAVFVRAGRVLGKGYHRRCGGPHAEVAALRDASGQVRGATLYVTMEPCCTCGKTPACTDALAGTGLGRVVAATLDPNPCVHGRGRRQLRAAGIDTEVGLLAAEARRLNEAYFTYHRRLRPFVTLKVAATLDGMLAAADGASTWISGPEARRRAQALRCAADAVLVGANTVVNDDPRLTCRVCRRRRLLRVVLDSRLRTSPRARLFRYHDPLLIFTASDDRRRVARLERVGARVVRVRLDRRGLLRWDDVLAELHRQQVLALLIEGGALVASSALDAGIVDKLSITHAPKLLGPGRVLTRGMKPRGLHQALRLTRIQHRVAGEDMITEGYVRHRSH